MVIKRLFSKAMALCIGLASLACFGLAGAADTVDEIPQTSDLTREAALSRSKRLPILLFFSSHHCAYCERVKREFLLPMQRDPAYANKVILRQIEYQGEGRLVDFSGKTITPAQFSAQQKIHLTPTIKLFDADGHVLTEPLVGLTTPEFYGAYLDRAIDEALAKVRALPR